MTDLGALASQLRQQAAANSAIVLDGTIFTGAVLTDVRTAFALAPPANLTIAGVGPADVPAPDGEVLTISAGTASVLGRDGVPITLAFTAPAQDLQVIITAAMGASWTFSDSFAGLDMFPFPQLSVSGAHFVYASTGQLAYPWPGDRTYSIELAAGMNFLASATLSNFSAIGALLGSLIGTGAVRIYGPFGPASGQQLPVGVIQAPLRPGSFPIGVPPMALTLGSPGVAVRIAAATALRPVQDVSLLIQADFAQVLHCTVIIPGSGVPLTITTTPLPNTAAITTLIESLPGGQGFTSYIPGELAAIFADVGLDNFTMVVDGSPKVTFVSLSISTLRPWPVILPDILILDGLNLRVEVLDPAGLNWSRVFIGATAEFLPHIFTGTFDFTVGLQRQTSWEIAEVSGSYYGVVRLGDLVGGLLGSQESVPEALRALQFSGFGIDAIRSGPGSPFSYTLYGGAEIALPVAGSQLTAQLNVSVTKPPAGYLILITGEAAIGSQVFAMTLRLDSGGARLEASWTSTGQPLEFGDIAAAFGIGSFPAIPPGLNLSLTSAEFVFSYDGGAALLIRAHSANYGFAVFQTLPIGGARVWAFGVSVPLRVTLADIPLVGDKLPDADQLGIGGLVAWLVSRPLRKSEAEQINRAGNAPAGYPRLPDADITGMATFLGSLLLGTATQPLAVPAGQPSAPQQAPAQLPSPAPQPQGAAPQPAAPPADPTSWVSVEKTFGVFTIHRIGVRYVTDGGNTLFVVIDAAIAVGPLSFSLIGLALGSPLTSFQPTFQLRGLALSYSAPPVLVQGALYAIPAGQLGSGVSFQYDGTAVVQAEAFTLAAIASYAQLAGGDPALFVFAQLRLPLGGPPAFSVTGLMAGFGFNRSLTLPAQDEVLAFPLLALGAPAAPGQPSAAADPARVLGILEGTIAPPGGGQPRAWITPRTGEYWLAVGLEFTSFQLVDTKALLVAEFGAGGFALALLGLATLRLPKQAAGSVTYAYVELELQAVLRPADGFFGLTAVLSANSYLLAPAAKLTGGFACYAWFGDNPQAGQFVLTIGGYHPAFTPPPYFPAVPAVGVNWAVSDVVSVKGTAYFALTTSCVMAGGGLEVVFSSGSLRAWFTAQADLLVSWNPFFFQAGIGVSIGVSYTLDVAGISKTLSVSVGASVRMWGPPTGGTVTVELYVISFTVDFGARPSQAADAPLSPAEFAALLPADPAKVTVTSGLAGSADDQAAPGQKIWLVRSGGFSFGTESAVPAATLAYGGATAKASTTVATGQAVDVRPMNLRSAVSRQIIRVQNLDDGSWQDLTGWSPAVRSRPLPASLFGRPLTRADGTFTQAPQQPSADLIAAAPVGATFTLPGPELGAGPGQVDLDDVAYEPVTPPGQPQVTGQSPLSWPVTPVPDYLPSPAPGSIAQITQLASGTAAAGRTGLLRVLDTAGLYRGAADPMTSLAATAGHQFTDPPMLVP